MSQYSFNVTVPCLTIRAQTLEDSERTQNICEKTFNFVSELHPKFKITNYVQCGESDLYPRDVHKFHLSS